VKHQHDLVELKDTGACDTMSRFHFRSGQSLAVTDFDLLSLLPRAPQKRSTPEILTRLAAAGHSMAPRSLQRRLISLSATHPIVCDDRSKPQGWSISSTAASTLGELSVQEAVTLKLAERYLVDAIPAELLDDLKRYFQQADRKLKEESLYRAWLGKVRLVPGSQPLGKPDVARNVMTNAYAGVLRQTVLNVTYRVRRGATAKTYDVEPLAIVVRGSVTYLVAQFPWADDVTLMALHRFDSIRATDRKNSARTAFDLDGFLSSGALGFMPKGEQAVRIRFYDFAGDHLLETPISPNQVLKEICAGESELHATLPITEQFKWWLLGFGDRAEVLAPASLRKEMHIRLLAAASRYNKSR